ncbi:hypothetical protein F444_12647 [Phytophthora nicotianae P1976]|uniref:Uncharacterized protein n=1 Tax=Phytophthora nicotianae P1976 TaxID=1317066 RepID=A0A080ZW89_PHYNI|nr:hypothetical protein F444_12647 [Phytophthora nicotianae P1976]
MEGKVIPSTMALDEDGKPLMSLEEMKEGMFQSIRDNGTVELIRAQLRRQFIEKLQQHRLNDDRDDENNAGRANQDAVSSTPDEKLVHGLVAEYLASKGLENTLAVFIPEIGGSRNQVDSTTILEKMERVSTGHSLLFVLVKELVRRFQLATMDSGTQTAMDCFDHRIVLENELRRVENSYLAECAAQKIEPEKSLEERMVQYQREYDRICEKRLQEELEQYKSTEVALVRAEERKRFNREVDNLRASLLQEYRNKQERLQEHERELELAFVARRTELETSLFETRQSLFKDLERLRVKEAELQVKVESDFRHFASETQRFQLWEESVRTQEANLEGIVGQAMREKERAWNIERQQALADIQTKQDDLADRERTLAAETGTVKTLKTQVVTLQQEVAALEAALSKSGDELRIAQSSALQLNKDRQRLEEKVAELETQLGEQNTNFVDVNTTNAQLVAEKSLVNDELLRYKQKNTEIKEQLKLITVEVKSLQQQILDMKLNEANAIVAERKKFMQIMEEERERSRWKESELLVKLREMQSRLAESEALAEKYQSQYEDERVHVEALRHDVSSLNSLLTQAQATINAKHGPSRQTGSFRAQRSSDSYETPHFAASDHQMPGGRERTFMMKMMEMMANFQQERAGNTGVTPDISHTHTFQAATISPTPQLHSEEQEEAKRLKGDQERIERELTQQREYEKKQQARKEEQERELAEQHREFEEKLARMRRDRIEEEERMEELRKRNRAEEEAKLQEDLARQRAEAAELQQKLVEQHLADEKQRLEEEQAFKERRLAEEQKLNREIEAKRRQQQLEDELAAKQREEREAEDERLRLVRKAQDEQERIRLEQEQARALQAAMQKQEEDRRQEELRLAEERILKDAVEASDTEAIEEASWKESSIEDEDEEPNDNEEKSGSDVEEIPPNDNVAEDTTSDVHSDNEAAEESVASAGSHNGAQGDDAASDISTIIENMPAKTPEEEEQERQKAAEEAKKKEDENVIDVYRQRVLARKAAEKQRQQELEAENERKAKEEEERQRAQLLDASGSDQELELSGGSFAESSAASNSDSF